MKREEKIDLLNKLLEIEGKNDIGNLTRAERGEFQQWINDAIEQEPCEDAISRHKAIVMITAYEGKSAQIEALKQLSSVKPQVICPSHGIDCEDCPAYEPKTDVLDKIRAEIEETIKEDPYRLYAAIEIIDRYKAESEDKE